MQLRFHGVYVDCFVGDGRRSRWAREMLGSAEVGSKVFKVTAGACTESLTWFDWGGPLASVSLLAGAVLPRGLGFWCRHPQNWCRGRFGGGSEAGLGDARELGIKGDLAGCSGAVAGGEASGVASGAVKMVVSSCKVASSVGASGSRWVAGDLRAVMMSLMPAWMMSWVVAMGMATLVGSHEMVSVVRSRRVDQIHAL